MGSTPQSVMKLQRFPCLLGSALLLGLWPTSVHAQSVLQIVPDTTLPVNSQVIPGCTVCVIDGGTIRGSTLFHSFQFFSLGTGSAALFNNPASIQTVLARVTGGSTSFINGLLQTNGTASLFFLNPSGIVFGPNAQLNVGGSFVASTATSFQFPDGTEFSATNPQAPPLLAVNVPLGLQHGPIAPGSTITNQGILTAGQDLTLVSDRLELQGTLQANRHLTLQAQDTLQIRDTAQTPFLAQAGGNLTLRGDRLVDILALNHPGFPFQSGGNLTVIGDGPISTDAHFTAGGNFAVRQVNGAIANFGSLQDPIFNVGGDFDVGNYGGASLLVTAGGNIRFGQVIISAVDPAIAPTRAFILRAGGNITATGDVVGFVPFLINPPFDSRLIVDFQAGGNITTQSVFTTGGPIIMVAQGGITTQTLSTFANRVPPGAITLTSLGSTIDTSAGELNTFARVGNGGAITFTALGNITTGSMDSGSLEAGTVGGAIALTSTGGAITALDTLRTDSFDGGAGPIQLNAAGNITTRDLFAFTFGDQNGGSIQAYSGGTFSATDSLISNGTAGAGRAGDLFIQADTIDLVNTVVNTGTRGTGVAGSLTLNSRVTNLSNGTALVAGTVGSGRGGNIRAVASEQLNLTGVSLLPDAVPTQIVTNTTGLGAAGDIFVEAGRVTMQGGALIATTAFGDRTGDGGDIVVNAAQVDLMGTSPDGTSPTRMATSSFGTGRAGDLVVNAQRVSIQDGALLTTAVLGAGPDAGSGGNLIVNATDSVLVQGFANTPQGRVPAALSADTFRGSGTAGNLTVNTPRLSVLSGGAVSVSSFGDGQGGTLTVNASDRVVVSGTDSSGFRSGLYAQAFDQGSAGNLVVNAGQLEIRDRGTITVASGSAATAVVPVSTLENILGLSLAVGPATGAAGNLSINARRATLTDSGQILASTDSGQGGNIAIALREPLVMRRNSLISATAGTAQAGGDGGNIAIAAPFLITAPFENNDIIANAFNGRGGNVTITAQGIYWFTPRSRADLIRLLGTTDPSQLDPRRLPTNDISAISQNNPALDGLVTLNTPDVDPSRGLSTLPVNLVDPSQLITTGCRPKSGEAGKFVATGRGGLPLSPENRLQREALSPGWVSLHDTSRQAAIAPGSGSSPPTAGPIVEASAIAMGANGEVYLTTATTERPGLPTSNPCLHATSDRL